jgi:hypothetical protein
MPAKKLPFIKTMKDMPDPPDEVWVTKSGEQIKVRDMEEHHVRNALRVMLRWKRNLDLNLPGVHDEVSLQDTF